MLFPMASSTSRLIASAGAGSGCLRQSHYSAHAGLALGISGFGGALGVRLHSSLPQRTNSSSRWRKSSVARHGIHHPPTFERSSGCSQQYCRSPGWPDVPCADSAQAFFRLASPSSEPVPAYDRYLFQHTVENMWWVEQLERSIEELERLLRREARSGQKRDCQINRHYSEVLPARDAKGAPDALPSGQTLCVDNEPIEAPTQH